MRSLLMTEGGFDSFLFVIAMSVVVVSLGGWLVFRKSPRRRRVCLVMASAALVVLALWRWFLAMVRPTAGGLENPLVEVRVLLGFSGAVVVLAAVFGFAAGIWVRRAER